MRTSGFLAGLVLVLAGLTGATATSLPEYHGGLFDDGFYDDDWYVDYYDQPLYEEQARMAPSEEEDEYEAGQLYDDAGESGLFDV